jgi:ATP-binding cassette subfamily B protein
MGMWRGGGGGGGMGGRSLRTPQRPKTSSWRIFRRAVGLFRPYAWATSGLLVLIIASAVLNLLPAVIIGAIVNHAHAGGDLGKINLLFGGLIAAVLFAGLLDVASGYINQVIGQGVMFRLRQSLHDHLQRLSIHFFTQTRTGEILSRVQNDVSAVQQAVTGTFTDFITNAITFGTALALMFAVEWRLALMALVILPLFTWPTMRMGMIQRRLMLQYQEETARMSGHLEETLSISGMMLVKTFGRQEHEAGKFRESNDTLRSLSIRRLIAGRWFNMGTSLFGAVAPGAVYWFGGRQVVGGDLSLGEVVTFAALTTRVFAPFTAIARINTTMLTSLALFERIFEYLDLPVEVEEKAGALSIPKAAGRLTFDHVTFSYVAGGTPALTDVSFDVAAGQMVALVGPSGAGKTSVTYLLQRFYDPQHGSVQIDGTDVRDLTIDSISRSIGAVLQDTYLFHTSLLENVRYGKLDATDDAVAEAAATAGLSDLVERLPEGIETVVGERGYRLSGGEKQRVALARAILKDPPILILDEATASLDSRLEREIREATAKLAETRTTVVIAHRLSTVVKADVILVLDHGRLVEQGTHEQLLAHEGLYASLYREQFATADEARPRR